MQQKQQLTSLEKQIKQVANYFIGGGGWPYTSQSFKWDTETKERLKELLQERSNLLNDMFLCTPEEVAGFEKVNTRLTELTRQMYSKASNLYRAILNGGYDKEFDDMISIEGTVGYVFCRWDDSIIWKEEELKNGYQISDIYGSDYVTMLEILYDYYVAIYEPECAFCRTTFDLEHRPEMPVSEFGLENYLDDGNSWAAGALTREQFKDICICHAVHDLCVHKCYSLPDLLRMNDFWCEVKIVHRQRSDQAGNRYSLIEPSKD
ncbi:MAG: hypothetical protein IKX71_06890 [Bacteroidales bacterium]|nr:hypothetical protein [Bacteroidales bacterium]